MFDPTKGRLVDNAATLGAVATITFTVPASKRWLILAGNAERDQNATFDAKITNAANKILWQAVQVAAGTSQVTIFAGAGAASHRFGYPILLGPGAKITYDWGAAQTTPEVTLYVLEFDI